MKPCTELCVDLKTLLCRDARARCDTPYAGVLYRRDEDHFLFREASPLLVHIKRNPRVFCGKYINITRSEEGELRFNFRAIQPRARLRVGHFAAQVAAEIISGLVGPGQEVEASAK